MGIRQTTPMGEIDRQIDEQLERKKRVLIRMLHVAGEKAVNEARAANSQQRGSYTDRTGNLRSSIGYVVVVDGKVYNGKGVSFEVVEGEKNQRGTQGAKDGKAFANQLADKFPTGIALIVVAGMKYAHYVQKLGFDVTISAEHLADKLLFQLGMPKTKRIEE